MSWLAKLFPATIRTEVSRKKGVPEGLWSKCESCSAVLYSNELERCLHVCPKCGHHHRISARKRLEYFLDPEANIEIGADARPIDHLKFQDTKKYKDRLIAAEKSTGERDALVVLEGHVLGLPVVAAAFEFRFMGGSMGAVVGQRFALGIEACLRSHKPFVCFSSSGGARMQEGMVSLLQMSKTSAALAKLAERGLPYISVLTDPTMGGVSASLAMLGDVIVAEPFALIGFAGPRVIEQTVREKLPEGFQRSEFLLEYGSIDQIIPRQQLRPRLGQLLAKLMNKKGINVV